jgi:murein tripeptide amidase MpaA
MVLWINFGVHGAEPSSMDAAIPLLYHFAAGSGAQIDTMLDNAVMLFAVVLNPDGHAAASTMSRPLWAGRTTPIPPTKSTICGLRRGPIITGST